MKKCPYCGHVYSDEDSVCSIDQNPLKSCDPKPLSPAPREEKTASRDEQAKSFATSDEVVATSEAPDGFRKFGQFQPIEADRLLKSFEAAGVRFQIELGQKRVIEYGYMDYGWPQYVTRGFVNIFVNNEDEEKAFKILNADWEV